MAEQHHDQRPQHDCYSGRRHSGAGVLLEQQIGSAGRSVRGPRQPRGARARRPIRRKPKEQSWQVHETGGRVCEKGSSAPGANPATHVPLEEEPVRATVLHHATDGPPDPDTTPASHPTSGAKPYRLLASPPLMPDDAGHLHDGMRGCGRYAV